ncbi:MAG TPA: tetratricopeptide repeat protein [Paludibacteraceae bacterium]|jgi:tetratricopeptide (TPR) repeat protein|nr:tetratricopeptide repeat protein [Paludibacteraceae bacterium]HPS10915.1 tetratricopeptide repeat protein [Paludibacteraceae bacterium]
MSKKVKEPAELETVGRALSSSEAFIEKYQKQILIGVGVIVLVVLAVMAVNNFYLKPRVVAAENAMYKAQELFAVDSFKVAVDGNGKDVMGFKEIASEYGMTASGNLANAYTGICYYKLGKYQDAVKYLTQYDAGDDYFKTSVIGLTGDCYAELGETGKAQDYYSKAIGQKNELSPVYLKKAGILFETKGQAADAEKMYLQIKNDYPKSMEAGDIDKYLARVQK